MGYLLFFQVSRVLHRQEVSKFLSGSKPKNLVSIPINASLADKISLGSLEEIVYKSEIYDVVDIVKSGNSYELICYKDSNEDRIIKTTAQHSNDPLSENQSSKAIRYFVDGMIKTAMLNDYSSGVYFSEVETSFSDKVYSYSGPFLSVPDLPPQIG